MMKVESNKLGILGILATAPPPFSSSLSKPSEGEREREMQQPTVSYTGHPHLLAVLDDAPSDAPPCNECGRPCDSPLIFRCARCYFNLHLLCGPLPKTIKLDEFPGEPFRLADSYAEDDSGEYYCDFCKDKRDPRECVYHSEDSYFVHFKCAMPEVRLVLSKLCILAQFISPVIFHFRPTGGKQSLLPVNFPLLEMRTNKP